MITQNHNSLCEEAKPYYYDCLCNESHGLIPESISDHIEQCQHCHEQIDQLTAVLSQTDGMESGQRQASSVITTMLELHFAYIGKRVTCNTVRPFLPGLLDPALETRIPTPITAHLDNCRVCAEDLKAIQKLNLNSTQLYGLSQFFAKGPSRNTTEFSEMAAVSAMAERGESEVVTIYHINESDKAQGLSESDDLYAGFPISVEIAHRNDKVDVKQPVSTIDFAAALKDKVLAMNLRPFLKIGLAAAAVILIGFAMLLNTTSAKAVTIEQLYKALEIAKNIHILKLVPGKTESTTEIIEENWVSRTLDIYMSKTEQGLVLWNVPNLQIKSKHSETGEIETDQLVEDDIPGIKQKISSSLGLMPFNDISQIPPGSELHRPDGEIPEVAEGIEIYDWILTKATYGSSVFNKWRFFVDPKKNLPKRIEIYRKSIIHSEYNLRTVIEVKYLRDSEIQAAIKKAGF